MPKWRNYSVMRRVFRKGNRSLKTIGLGRPQTSNTHGHDDVAITRSLIGQRAQLAGGLFILQFEADGAIGRGVQEIEKILRIETNGDGVAFGLFLDHFFCFAVFRARSRNLQAFFREHEFHGMRTLVSELRDSTQSVLQLAAIESHGLVRVPRKHRFIIRKLAGELTRSEQTSTKLEKEVALVLRKFNAGFVARFGGKPL